MVVNYIFQNSIIIFPGWVEHGVREVSIEGSDYYDGFGRYCISNFFGSKQTKSNRNQELREVFF